MDFHEDSGPKGRSLRSNKNTTHHSTGKVSKSDKPNKVQFSSNSASSSRTLKLRRRRPRNWTSDFTDMSQSSSSEEEDVEYIRDVQSVKKSSQRKAKRLRKSSLKRGHGRNSQGSSSKAPKSYSNSKELKLEDLNSECLESISAYLDTESSLALFRTSKTLHWKLSRASGFWKALCQKENFLDYSVLKKDEEDHNKDDNEEASDEEDDKSSSDSFNTREMRLTYNGDKFHDVKIPPDASLYRKVFLRGVQMRRNICAGRFELWRLFLTDHGCLPVKRMTQNTSFRELRSSHRRSPFNTSERRVRIHRYWNEDFLIALSHSESKRFNDVFVWKWQECQNPQFLYSYDLNKLYSDGIFPTAFFLYKNYLVFMPGSANGVSGSTVRAMVRVHDLNENMALVGSYDFPENSPLRRHIRPFLTDCNEAAHLHKIGNCAVAICRVPDLRLFIFSLPDCKLLREVVLSEPNYFDNDDLDQRIFIRDHTIFFLAHDMDFFNLNFDLDGAPIVGSVKYGKLVMVDMAKYMLNGGPVVVRIDPWFENNDDYIEKMALIDKNTMVCSLNSGSIVFREMIFDSSSPNSSKLPSNDTNLGSMYHIDAKTIPAPDVIPEDYDSEVNGHLDIIPNLCVSRDGKFIAEMRQFRCGRRLYVYNREGVKLYFIDLDDEKLGLTREPGYVTIDMDGNFLCAADVNHFVIWRIKDGKFVRSISIPKHYNVREDPSEQADIHCWKGHSDFAFAEDGIIIIHSQRNFPIAADIFLFW